MFVDVACLRWQSITGRVRLLGGGLVTSSMPTPTVYRDRLGKSHMSWNCALPLAEAFARAEPKTVLDNVNADERERETEARQSRSKHFVRLLTERRAAWALVRQWAGSDDAIASRETRSRSLRSR